MNAEFPRSTHVLAARAVALYNDREFDAAQVIIDAARTHICAHAVVVQRRCMMIPNSHKQ